MSPKLFEVKDEDNFWVKNLINAIVQEKRFFREVNSDISIIICFMSKFYAILAQSRVIFWRLIC